MEKYLAAKSFALFEVASEKKKKGLTYTDSDL